MFRDLHDRRALTGANLIEDFGHSSACGKGLMGALARALSEHLNEAGNNNVKTLFKEWRSLFGQVADLSRAQQDDVRNEIGFTMDTGSNLRIPAALFVIHTYHALIIKLLAAEILSAHHLTSFANFAQVVAAFDEDTLLRRLATEIEKGEYYARAGIRGFVEESHFSWYVDARAVAETRKLVLEALRSVLVQLSLYRTDQLMSARSGDLLKHFYQDLVPDVLRKTLGEFYTPDWLVQFTLEQAQVSDWMRVRALDPTCGSGSFLLEVIRRKRVAGQAAGLSARDLLHHLLRNVWGFDLNPLAVLAARVNYLIAIADLLTPGEAFELPVLLADAIYSPARNASATAGQFDLIAGNPPWVRWSKLPELYREQVKPTCDQYRIFSGTLYHGGSELDISGVVTYAVADKWLRVGGTLAFVITQTHFQSPSSEGVRNWHINEVDRLLPLSVDDMKAIKPFPDAANKPAVAVFRKARNEEPTYPVPYRLWTKRTARVRLPVDLSLAEALERLTVQPMEATPVGGPGSPWAILPPGRFTGVQKIAGQSTWVNGRKGITADLNGIYFVTIQARNADRGLVQISTRPEAGKTDIGPAQRFWVEPTLLFPLLKGAADFSACRMHRDHSLFAFVPNQGITGAAYTRGAAAMNSQALSRTRAYFAAYEHSLQDRSTYKGRQKNAPYYVIYNVGEYTFAPWKIIWAEQGDFCAALAGKLPVPLVGTRPCVPDHKIFFADFVDRDRACYLCGLLNSPLVKEFVDSHIIPIQRGDVFKHLTLPVYLPSNPDHARLVQLVADAHETPDEKQHAELLAQIRILADHILV